MPAFQEVPIPVQTAYAELVEKAWTSDLTAVKAAGGSPYVRKENGRKYWYWQPPTADGKRPSAKYLGPDNEATRARVDAMVDEAEALRVRRDLVRSLRAARLPVPDRLSGEVLEALAEAGVFRLRAVVVGSVAFLAYSGLLGVRIPASLSRTGDLDIAQFHSIALAVDDEIDGDLEQVLKRVDKRFVGIPDPRDGRRTLRYALRAGKQEMFSVDVLCPLRGPERETVIRLRALRSHAQVIRFLDFLLYQEINAVALHGAGVPINVPTPERYGLHKLLVAQMRKAIPRSQEKARKDLDQASALIRVLAHYRPGDLADAWVELRERGPSWRQKADRSLVMLPNDVREALDAAVASVRSRQ